MQTYIAGLPQDLRAAVEAVRLSAWCKAGEACDGDKVDLDGRRQRFNEIVATVHQLQAVADELEHAVAAVFETL